MTYLNPNDVVRPINPQPQGRPNEPVGAAVNQVGNFIKDHFINGGKLGVSLAMAAAQIARGFAQAKTDAFKERLPELQHRIGALPTAVRAVLVNGGDAETREILRSNLAVLTTDASLAAQSGAFWGLTGVAYATMPLTVAAGYTLGAALGEQRAGKLITQAMDNDATMQERFSVG